MFAIIASLIFMVIIFMNILLICGAPLGELTMGGQYRILPNKMKVLAIISLVIQFFAAVIVLQAGGFLGLWFSHGITRIICYAFAGYFVLNSIMCAFSKSKKERYIMTPLSFLAAVCYFITAFEM